MVVSPAPPAYWFTGRVSTGFAPGTSPTTDANSALNSVKLVRE
jgi:hypothetical protein